MDEHEPESGANCRSRYGFSRRERKRQARRHVYLSSKRLRHSRDGLDQSGRHSLVMIPYASNSTRVLAFGMTLDDYLKMKAIATATLSGKSDAKPSSVPF